MADEHDDDDDELLDAILNFCVVQSATKTFKKEHIDVETLGVIVQGLKSSLRPALAPNRRQFRRLPFHLILEILDYLEQRVLVHVNDDFGQARTKERVINSERELWGTFAADPTRKPIFVWRSLRLWRPTSVQNYTQNPLIRDQWVLRALVHVRYLSIDLAVRELSSSIAQRANKKTMPQLRAVTNFHLDIGMPIQQNKYFADRVTCVQPYYIPVDFSRFLTHFPALRNLNAMNYCGFSLAEFKAIEQISSLKTLAITVDSGDVHIFDVCKRLVDVNFRVREVSVIDALYKAMENTNPCLRRLVLSAMSQETTCLISDIPVCSTLLHLTLKEIGPKEGALKQLFRKAPNLQSLHLEVIKVSLIKEIQEANVNLKSLALNQILWTSKDQPEQQNQVLRSLLEAHQLEYIALPIGYLQELSQSSKWAWSEKAEFVVRACASLRRFRLYYDSHLIPFQFACSIPRLLLRLPKDQIRSIEIVDSTGLFPRQVSLAMNTFLQDLADQFGLESIEFK